MTQLTFDEEETETVKPRQSATAATLLKNISASSMSSDGSFFSLQSSGSKASGSVKSRGSYKLSLGLEGNIVKDADKFEETLVHEESSHSNDASVLESGKADVSLQDVNKTTLVVENNVSSHIIEDKKNLQNSSIISQELKINGESNLKPNHRQSLTDDYENDPKSPDNYKNISVQFTNPSPYLNRTKGDLLSAVNENNVKSADGSYGEESEDESFKKPVLKWTREKREENKESLELEICKIDKAGLEQHVATVSVSQQIPLYHSDAVEIRPILDKKQRSVSPTAKSEKTSIEDSLKEELPPQSAPNPNNTMESTTSTLSEESFSEELQSDKAVFSSTWINTSKTNTDIFSPLQITEEDQQEISNARSSLSTTTIGEIPLDQVLDELVKKKRICSVVKETSSNSKENIIEEDSAATVPFQTSVNESHAAVESEVEKESEAEIWEGELEDDIHLSYHESTHHIEHESSRCDNSEISSPQPIEEQSAKEDKHEPPTIDKSFSSQNEEDAENPEIPSIFITSVTSMTSQSFGIQSESIGDFELRMSEGESTYDAPSQEEVEEEGESKEIECDQDVGIPAQVEEGVPENDKTGEEVDFPEEVEVAEEAKAAEVADFPEEVEVIQVDKAAEEADSPAGSAITYDEKIEVTGEETEPRPNYQTLSSVQFHEDHIDEECNIDGKNTILTTRPIIGRVKVGCYKIIYVLKNKILFVY